MLKILRNRAVQQGIFQAFVVLCFVYVLSVIWHNTTENLAHQGIASGFAFLDHPAGFDIIMHLIDYDANSSYLSAFYVGILNTLAVAIIGIVIATVLGFIIGVTRLSSNWLIAKIALSYIEIMRNLPLLLQIFFWYFAVLRNLPPPRQSFVYTGGIVLNNRGLFLPKLMVLDHVWLVLFSILISILITIIFTKYAAIKHISSGKKLPVTLINIAISITVPLISIVASHTHMQWDYPVLKGFNYRGGVELIPEFIALTLALSIYTAAFIAEIVRAGIQSIDKGQLEAARSLGLSRVMCLKLIIIPQAMRVILPPLTNQYLNLTKNSSLATAIAYPDLVAVFAGTSLNQTGQAIEIIAMTMAVYLFLSITISIIMNVYQHVTGKWSTPR